MKFSCRVLDQSETAELWRLTSTAKDDCDLQLWEDRSENFIGVYNHHRRGEARYYGLFDGSKIVGCSGLVPTTIAGTAPGVTAYLDTDLFIHPEYRRQDAVRRLLSVRIRDAFEANRDIEWLTFGVEHRPGLLDLCRPFVEAEGGEFRYPWQTTLTQVFLLQPRQFEVKSNSEYAGVRSCLLPVAPAGIVQQWLELLEPARTFLSPRADASTLAAMAQADKDAELFWIECDGAVVAAALLYNEESGRRYRITDKPGLMVERMKRSGRWSAKTGDILPIGIVCLTAVTSTDSVSLKAMLFSEIVDHAYQRRLSCLLFRDEPMESLQQLSADVFQFERRAFVKLIPRTSLEEAMRTTLQAKMDSAFL